MDSTTHCIEMIGTYQKRLVENENTNVFIIVRPIAVYMLQVDMYADTELVRSFSSLFDSNQALEEPNSELKKSRRDININSLMTNWFIQCWSDGLMLNYIVFFCH